MSGIFLSGISVYRGKISLLTKWHPDRLANDTELQECTYISKLIVYGLDSNLLPSL